MSYGFVLRRRSVYFLNKCFIRVFYRFNRSRRYKLVSEPWSVLSGLVFVGFPVCTRMVLDYLRYLFCVLLFLSVGWFCVVVRWLVAGMMRQLHRLWLQWPMCWLKPMNRRRLVVRMKEKLRSEG